MISLDNYFNGRKENHIPGAEYREGHTKDIDRLVPEAPDIIYHLGEYARIAPSFDDVEPWHIKHALPYLWIWRREPKTGRFICRVCGEHVNYIFGRNISGKAVDEVIVTSRENSPKEKNDVDVHR